MIATCESKELAEDLLATTIAKQHVAPGELTIHSDNGASMASRSVAFLLADLGRFVRHRPQPAPLPGPAWINPPPDSTNDHAN